MVSSLTLERALNTVVSVFTTFFDLWAELLLVPPAAPSDGFLFWSGPVTGMVARSGRGPGLVACSGRGPGLAGAFLAGFGTARGAAG
jgi:hypothetical protein